MTPVKYTSPFCDKPFFLIKIKRNKTETFAVTPEGQQPEHATPHVNKKEAEAWLKDNGLTRS